MKRIIPLALILSVGLSVMACSGKGNYDAGLSASYRLSGDAADSQCVTEDSVITIGQKDSGKYIESYELVFDAPEGKDISIAYRTHIQDAGWCQWSPSGTEMAYEQYYGIDTIQIMFYGKDAFMYDVYYRVAVVGEDWQDWVSNGALAGAPEEHRVIEAIEIRIEINEDYKSSKWTLTEFTDDSGNQAMFYTLLNNDDGTLVVVDGGWDANTEQVRSVIGLFGGTVDHWFITHYDEDHASVFNAIYNDPDGIEIGQVYASPMDYDYYLGFAVDRPWETPWVYETFLAQTEGDDRIHYLCRGDEFEIDGLQIDVFNSYDQMVVDTGNPDVANNTSLVFKITGDDDSILFCADIRYDLGMQILDMYGDAMDAEYVQAAHHGNNTVPYEFYEQVGAQVVLFDGPAWLTQTENYPVRDLIAQCRDNGITTYEFETAPNSFGFN